MKKATSDESSAAGIAELPASLTYVDDRDPGIRRRASAKGFAYTGVDDKPVKDAATLSRIKALVVPPAWTDVWICPDASGHIQATGRDAKGRKQYRYHADWRRSRDHDKYDKMIDFGRKLPQLRARIEEDMALRGLPREKVVAAVVRLLELTLIRVGNDAYAKQNKSFGLTTMRMRHVELGATGAVFEFRGKSGVSHKTGFRDRKLARVVKACGDLPGQRLFQYLDEDGERRSVGSSEVNTYIHDAMGNGFSAKDFRTWAGALAALEVFDSMEPPASAAQAKAMIRVCVEAVSRLLGNTPAVCRACYIHPAVIEAFEAGELTRPKAGTDPERRLIRLLESARESAA